MPSQRYLPSSPKARESTDAVESFYYYQGKAVWLQRSGHELSVRFRPKVSTASESTLVGELSASARLSRASRLRGRDLSAISVKGKSSAGFKRLFADLKAKQNVEFAYPAWVDPRSGGRLLLTDELVVRLKDGSASAEARDALAARGLAIARKISYSSDEYVLRLLKPKKSDPLAVSRALYRSGLVEWAEPNFVQELHKDYVPNDPLFPQQWHLRNTGQSGGTVNADAHLSGAWDLQTGGPDTTIAIIDDGVQLTHPDLSANIYTNPGEIPGNGVDDDGNGYVDDVHGWNFLSNNNNANPTGFTGDIDSHGTAVAGVAAARGDNGIGVAGACPNCTILPVKIATDDVWATDSAIADAIRYAGRMADVINISWGGSVPSSALQYALQYALTIGRDGKGAVVFVASGNGASGFMRFTLSGLPPDTYRFRWTYSKNESDAGDVGADTAWLGWVRFPDGEVQNFEAGSDLPPGWSTGGDSGASWSVVTDPAHSDSGSCWSHAAKAGKISNNQQTYVEVVKTFSQEGDLDFLGFVSSEVGEFHLFATVVYVGLDGLRLWVDKGNDGTWDWSNTELWAGVPPTDTGYPAAYPQAIAVGASTSLDCPASYSQFGPELALVAPSSGGGLTGTVVTTDRTGSAGYSSGDYFSGFGGTSAAAPLAAGVAGLVLSRNPGLTEAQVREILENSADKIDPELGAYDASGHSDRFGYGRIDAQRALEWTPLPTTIAFSQPRYKVAEARRTAVITVRRSGNLSVGASADFATVGGTARGGTDFGIVWRAISFAPGESSKTISIPIRKHATAEPARSFSLRLSNPSPGAVLGRPSASSLTIMGSERRLGRITAASLSRTVFERSEAAKTKLIYRFSPLSKSFRYVLSLRKGAKWVVVRRVSRKGVFKGSRTSTIKALFARTPIVPGRYRLRLSADANTRQLAFRIE
ncbi:MAG: S8 family serine peptidase [Gaiellaceae bacterium]